MDITRQRNAITEQGKSLRKRAEFQQKMVQQAMNQITVSQETARHFNDQLQATNLAIDALRQKLRELEEQEGK